MKAWCVWCESPKNSEPQNGYYWIHMSCAEKLMDIKSDLNNIQKILERKHRRNKENENELITVDKFIKDMEIFNRRWEGTMKIIKDFKGVETKKMSDISFLVGLKFEIREYNEFDDDTLKEMEYHNKRIDSIIKKITGAKK